MRVSSLSYTIALAATLSISHALVDLPLHARGGKLWADIQAQRNEDHLRLHILQNSTPNYFTQLIYHNDSSMGTFTQRYFVDYSYWSNPATGPVILNIGGEGPEGGSPGGMVAVYGQSVNALLLSLEHRYYGDSLPAPLTDRTTLSTLSVETAMHDIAAFLTNISQTFHLTAANKIIVVGGSYSGALSAWFRETHPEIAAMSWSSSGVVNAVFEFTGFDEQLVEDVSTSCGDAIRSAMQTFSTMFDDPTQQPALLAMFNTPTYFTKTDMAWMLADSVAMGPQYGAKATLCTFMQNPSASPIDNLANWTVTHYGPSFGSSCYYSTKCLSDPSMSAQWAPGGYPWVYQCCSELAYWQAYENEQSFRLPIITTEYYTQQCETAFGPGTFANTTAFNAKFGGATPNATNVIALNGSDDPWQRAAVNQSLSPSYPMFMATCDGCGHCGDLSANAKNPAIAVQHAAITAYLNQWLAE